VAFSIEAERPVTYAYLIGKIIELIVRKDGDRDHMNHSELTCEQTMAIVELLRRVKPALEEEVIQ
jgi:hypothetical protein